MSDFTIDNEDWEKLIKDHQLDKVITEQLPIDLPRDEKKGKDNVTTKQKSR